MAALLLLLLLLLLLALSFPTSFSETTLCEGTNSTTTAAFLANLNHLLDYFPSTNATFSTRSYGSGPFKVYGLSLCRGDASLLECSNCLSSATHSITENCPNNTEASVWIDDHCLLRYSGTPFFTSVDTKGKQYVNRDTATELDKFSELKTELLKKLVIVAAYNSPIMYATGTAEGRGLPEIYGLVQCTRDLSAANCSTCLTHIITEISQSYPAQKGAQSLANSCIFRYEVYSFFSGKPSISLAPPPSSSAPPPEAMPPAVRSLHHGAKNSTVKVLLILLPIVGILVLVIVAGVCYRRTYAKHIPSEAALDEIPTGDSLLFSISVLRAATGNFADSNKLGQGGFGTVYKGILPNGEAIAVKRLSGSSKQGIEELKNELILVAKLQHKNLVRIRGVCLEEEEKLLVYEYMPNRSLDNILFDPVQCKQLNWQMRFNIILGIARGLLYLHEEAHLKVIHRDLKASNILLDAKMNPKISDFGLARLFGEDEQQRVTSRVVGTFGYMSPEYVRGGQFSMKSDVYSFGILLLEIVTGKFNGSFKYDSEYAQDVLSYAWGHWINSTALQIMDPSLGEDYSSNEALRCIQIALICAQEVPANRPLMPSIFLMLQSPSMTLQQPLQPRYIAWMSTDKSTSSSEQSARCYNKGLANDYGTDGEPVEDIPLEDRSQASPIPDDYGTDGEPIEDIPLEDGSQASPIPGSPSSPYEGGRNIRGSVSEPQEESKLIQERSMSDRELKRNTT